MEAMAGSVRVLWSGERACYAVIVRLGRNGMSMDE